VVLSNDFSGLVTSVGGHVIGRSGDRGGRDSGRGGGRGSP